MTARRDEAGSTEATRHQMVSAALRASVLRPELTQPPVQHDAPWHPPTRLDLIAPADDVWSVTQLTTAAKRIDRGRVAGRSGCGARSSGCKVVAERALVLHPPRRRRSQVRCCMWKRDTPAARASRRPTAPRSSCWRGRGIYEVKGEFQLNVTRMLPTAAIGQAQQELERVKAAAAEGRALRPGPKAAAARVRAHARRGHQHGRRRAARHHHRRAAALAARAAAGGRRAGAGRRRRRGAGPRAPAGQSPARAWTAASWAGAAAAARTSRRSTPRRFAARSPRCGCPPSPPWATRPTSRSPTWSPTSAPPTPSAAAELALADQREVRRALDDLAARLAGGSRGRTRLGLERVERAGDRLHAAHRAPCSSAAATSSPGSRPSSTR